MEFNVDDRVWYEGNREDKGTVVPVDPDFPEHVNVVWDDNVESGPFTTGQLNWPENIPV